SYSYLCPYISTKELNKSR
ncbi:MV membrane EFC component, partial [Monkeypox virus]